MTIRSALYGLILFAAITGNSIPIKDWQGIVPLRSTCNDVKKVFKVDKCTYPLSIYNLPEYRVVVSFSENQNCKNPQGWNVSLGTVTSLVISPRKSMSPSEFGVDVAKYKKSIDDEIVGLEHYESCEEGIRVNLFNGHVQDIFFYPSLRDEKLRCKSAK